MQSEIETEIEKDPATQIIEALKDKSGQRARELSLLLDIDRGITKTSNELIN